MENRKLSTIVFIDIAGYTALMQENEAKALEFLNYFKKAIEQESSAHQGKIVQYFGDGCLLSFDSSWNAVTAAMAMQKSFIEKDIPVRIGMHLGDVLFKENNVFGDGVNIASRVESLGVPGAILISGTIRNQVKNKEGIKLTTLGSFDFKNVEESMEVYALSNPEFIVPQKHQMKGKLKEIKKNSKGWKWLLLISIVIFIAMFIFWHKKFGFLGSGQDSTPRLAVLEFVNIGEPPAKGFTSRFTDEINGRLNGLQHLAVISRSSTSLIKNTSKSPDQIGKELEVDYVLEGTAYWSINTGGQQKVRILPNLVRVSDNTQVWSGQYDLDYHESDDTQTEIINELLRNLNIAISEEEQSILQATLSTNPLALEAYLKGIKAKPAGHGAKSDFIIAFNMFQQAVSLDKDFTLAWVKLGEVYKDLYWFGYSTNTSMLDSALSCIEKARILDPSNPHVTISLGDYYYRLREYDKALKEFAKIMTKRPNDSELLQKISEVWRRQGFFDQALETMEKALRLDPYNVNSITELSWTYIFVGDFERALELQKQARQYDPDAVWNHLMGAFILWNRGQLNDLANARALLENVPNPQSSYPAWFWVTQSWFENDAKAILKLLKNLSVEAIELQHSYEPVTLLEGLANKSLGRDRAAKKDFRDAVSILNRKIEENPTDFRMHMALGLAYAGLEEKELAINSGKEAAKLLPLEKDHLLGLDILYNLMRIYALLGEDDLSLDVMAKLLSVPCQYRGFFFTANPEFVRVRNNSRFQDLLDKQSKMLRKYRRKNEKPT